MRKGKPPEIITLTVRGIKCDAAGCGWKDDSVQLEDYADWLGRPCPVCSANVLTRESLDTLIRCIKAAKVINRVYGFFWKIGLSCIFGPRLSKPKKLSMQHDTEGLPLGFKEDT